MHMVMWVPLGLIFNQCGSKGICSGIYTPSTLPGPAVSALKDRDQSPCPSLGSRGLDDNLIRWDGKQRGKVWPCMARVKATSWISLSPHANSGLSGFYIYQRQVYPLPLSLTDASLKVTLGKDPVSCVQSGGLSRSGFYGVRNLTFVKVLDLGTLTPEVPVTAGFFAPPSHPCTSILCD